VPEFASLDSLIIHPLLLIFKDSETFRLVATVPLDSGVRWLERCRDIPLTRRRSPRMKENNFEPAKIVGTVDGKQKQPPNPGGSTNPTAEKQVVAATGKPSPDAQQEIDGESWQGIMGRFTGKEKSAVVWASPYDMYENGVFSGLYKSTVDKVAKDIQGIVVATVFHAYLLIGYYLLAVFFDNDESKAFSRNPYKETSLNDLAKRDDIPFTRQKLTDCIKAAAVDMELNKYVS